MKRRRSLSASPRLSCRPIRRRRASSVNQRSAWRGQLIGRHNRRFRALADGRWSCACSSGRGGSSYIGLRPRSLLAPAGRGQRYAVRRAVMSLQPRIGLLALRSLRQSLARLTARARRGAGYRQRRTLAPQTTHKVQHMPRRRPAQQAEFPLEEGRPPVMPCSAGPLHKGSPRQ